MVVSVAPLAQDNEQYPRKLAFCILTQLKIFLIDTVIMHLVNFYVRKTSWAPFQNTPKISETEFQFDIGIEFQFDIGIFFESGWGGWEGMKGHLNKVTEVHAKNYHYWLSLKQLSHTEAATALRLLLS